MNTKHSALGFFGALGAIVAVLAFAFPGPVNAQENAIEAIEVSPQQAGRTTVRVTLKAPPAAPPAGFSIANPPRIAFDFPNTTNASGRNVQDVSGGDLRRINVVQASGRTRMVLELARGLSYDARVDGRTVLVGVSPGGCYLLQKDPTYLANLQALSYVDRARLLGDKHRGGNWKIVPAAGKIFNKAWFEIVDAVPAGMTIVRFWDEAPK